MIIPTSFINSNMELCAKDDGHGTDAVMHSHECWSQAGLRKGSLMLDSRWEMCNSLRSLLALASRGSARLVAAILAEYPVAFGQAEAVIKQ